MCELIYKCSADPDNISLIDDLIIVMLRSEGENELRTFSFAVHELIINSVESMQKKSHSKSDGNILIKMVIERNTITFCINDWGEGIPEEVLNKRDRYMMEDNLLQESGRGLSLIQSFVDDFTIERECDGSYKYTIIKNKK